MKLHSSSSSLDLSSTDAAGCISNILRRILRRTSTKDVEQAAEIAEPKKAPPCPGLVARLMGLDSMPVHPSPLPDSITRSRSTNSIETWHGFLSHKRNNSDPAVKSSQSQSSREVSTFLTKENDEFLLLSFGRSDGEEAQFCGEVTPEPGFGELKMNVGGEERNERRMTEKRAARKSRRKLNQIVERERPANARKKLARSSRKIDEVECSCQDSSPISVLEQSLDTDGECSLSPESPVSVKIEDRNAKSRTRDSRSRLISDLADRKDASLSIEKRGSSGGGGKRRIERVKSKLRQPEPERNDFSQSWALICRIAKEDVKRSNWVSKEDAGDIAAVIGLEIVDYLLYETVAEL